MLIWHHVLTNLRTRWEHPRGPWGRQVFLLGMVSVISTAGLLGGGRGEAEPGGSRDLVYKNRFLWLGVASDRRQGGGR